MKLAAHEVASPLWQKLKDHHESVLAAKRARLENPRIEERERIQLAWQIDTVKEFLALGEPGRKQKTDAG